MNNSALYGHYIKRFKYLATAAALSGGSDGGGDGLVVTTDV
jgi:hypothetical protein